MDAETAPPRAITTQLRAALGACRTAWSHAARLALDIALPTLCVACREPVDGEGVCASCWAKLSFIAPPYCPRLGIPFVYDPGPELLSMEAIASPPAYQRARAAVRYDEVARTLVHALKYQDRTDLAPAMGRWMARAGLRIAR
jgi:predicted amidophosphoribosyltransferase